MALTRFFAKALDRFELLIQGTVVIAEGSVFEPDLALLRRRPEGYRYALPRPEDVLLAVESAGSSWSRDRHVKLPIYAAAGIQEYWIIDLERESLLVFREPAVDAYRVEQPLRGDDRASPLACPELTIRVADFFA
jgi:Uma2 family endonuclease